MLSGVSKLLILEYNSEVTTLNDFSITLNYKVTTMEADVNSSVVSIVLILIAAASLFAMISLNQINYIVHGDLYSFGLQFSYRWAIPYWLFSGIVFGLSWMNITIAIIVTLYIFKKRQKQALVSKSSQTEETVIIAQIKEKKEQRKMSEYVQPQKGGLTAFKEESAGLLSEEIKQPEDTTETVEAQEIFSQQMTEEKSESVKETEEAHVPPQDFEKRRSIL